MGKHDNIHGCRVEVRKAAVDFICVLAMALVESTIQQDAFAVHFQQMLRSRSSSRRPAKFEFHITMILASRRLEATKKGGWKAVAFQARSSAVTER
jgi:hypothetical protein